MIIVGVFMKFGSQVVHQALGRNFHPPPGGIAIGEMITPLVIGFPGDLALPQRVTASGESLQPADCPESSPGGTHRRQLPPHGSHSGPPA